MSELEIKIIRERCEAATPGPWVWSDGGEMLAAGAGDEDDMRWDGQGSYAPPTKVIETDSGVYPPRDNDRAFIAAARSDVPALLDEIDRLRTLLRQAWTVVHADRCGVRHSVLCEQIDALFGENQLKTSGFGTEGE